MIYATDIPLRIQTVTTAPRMINLNGDDIPPQPVFIIRVASRAEYLAQCARYRQHPASVLRWPYCYEVSTD